MNNERITNLEALIAQGEQLERNGYHTGTMNQINRELLRAERLQEITVKDIEREGMYCDAPYTRDHFAYAPGMMIHWRNLWDSTIKPADLDKYGCSANPWVWVISFERCEKPEDFA